MKNLMFKGKSVLISGGSRGIGAATVRKFYEAGAEIAFTYEKNEDAANALINNIRRSGQRIMAGPCDGGDSTQVSGFVQSAIQYLKKIDILVNNAGIWEYGPLTSMSEQQWRRTLSVNLDSVFFFTKLVIEHMLDHQNSGRIIHVSSTAGQRGEAFHSHYAASKGAIISFTKSLAAEFGAFGININCVAPGWVMTDMSEDAIRRDRDAIINGTLLKRIPDPEEIAGPILFLASEWATAITGEILNVNAGSVLCG